ncbi:MAG: 2,3-diphosphoglycerate-dependent phosphoglycerate mutase [Candidatus Pacebacteria bacterium]|nr:2,3-diphosphoglycerate-dependent phosphoglycerate mutase [Candidatus Paceibacterota bacterium]
MAKLLLLRHLQSQWNKENRFTGWTDIPLSEEGIESAKEVAEKLAGFQIDKVYTSPLTRNRGTVSLILENLGKIDEDKSSSSPFTNAWVKDVPIIVDKALDERNYGRLQGLNKNDVKRQYGEAQVKLWRRGWNDAPPEGESLKDVYNRVVPFYEEHIEKDLKEGKNVLVVASHNSLRALVKHIENISDEQIINFEIPTGGLKEYDIVA